MDIRDGPTERSPNHSEFSGNERFDLELCLGRGGMGVVYRVYDKQRKESVALKTLGQRSPSGVYELKREFRALQGIRHPNLISLHELVATEGQCFFTMELLEAVPFCDHFHYHSRTEEPANTTEQDPPGDPGSNIPAPTLKGRDAETADRRDRTMRVAFEPQNHGELRRCLRQLVSAVATLHRAGKLHRDLKPKNVLITRSGRVVVLDFGLAQDLSPADPNASSQALLVAGTPAYMAPEQAAGRGASEASDWYAVGVMLYETLTARLPFNGNAQQVLEQKVSSSPRSLLGEPGIPTDLAKLCDDLLARSPEKRPRAEEILSRLGVQSELPRVQHKPDRSDPFVGREQHLEALRKALLATRAGAPRLVWVRGKTGTGKSRLMDHFANTVAANMGAIVLEGRCRPRESLPFKALDELIDSLARWLRSQPDPAHLIPRHCSALTQIFPVLGRVPAVAAAPAPLPAPEPGAATRRVAFDALKELLARLADQRPLVLKIDDLQWGDGDGLTLLAHLLSAPNPPSMLVLLGHTEDEATALLQVPAELRPFADESSGAPDRSARSELMLDVLPFSEATQLALALLPRSKPSGELAQAIAKESDGHPATIHELATLVRSQADPATASVQREWLDQARSQRMKQLSADEVRLLAFVALGYTPLSQKRLLDASGMSREICEATLGSLLSKGLCKVWTKEPDDLFSVSDEHIYRWIEQRLPPELAREVHLALAKAAEASHSYAHAAKHYASAGEPKRQAEQLRAAAKLSASALAFDRAVHLLEAALAADAGQLAPAVELSVLQELSDYHQQLAQYGLAAKALERAAKLAEKDASTTARAAELSKRALLLRTRTPEHAELMSAGAVSQYTLFDGLPRTSAERLLAKSRILEGEPGDVLASVGSRARDFFVVLRGAVQLRQDSQLSGRIGENEILGEVGFLLDAERSVDVCVMEPDTRVLSVSRESLDDLAIDSPRIALRLVMNLARIVCGKLVMLRERVMLAPSASERPSGEDSPAGELPTAAGLPGSKPPSG